MTSSDDAVTLAPDASSDAVREVVRGASVGRYVVLAEAGRGGMGRVLRAYDPKLQREVALKSVRRETLGAAGTARLVSEARALAKLSHPNVVAVYDVEELEHGEVVIVMEYVAGQTLTAWLQRARPWPQVLAQLRRAGRGLAAAHAAGLLHRDFKPDNVLVGDDGRVRVTDFGLARELVAAPPEEHELTTSPCATEVTAAGAIVGTLPYLAPERIMAAPADAATDQYAYCVALWEALFGTRPFRGATAIELAFAIAAGPPRPPVGAPRVPAWLLAAITRGLASDPRARWPSMRALLDVFGRDHARRRRRALGASTALVALALGAGVQAWATARAERCSDNDARAHLEDAWGEARRAEVQAALLAVDAPYTEEVWTSTAHALDEYATAWTQAHVEACAASSIRGEQSAKVLDLRMSCLHRAKVELTAVTGVLARADARTMQRAHAIVAGLRPLARCGDVDALHAEVEPPLPEEVDAVEAVHATLADVRAAMHAARFDEARRAIADARAGLDALGYRPVHTEVELVHGELLDALGEYQAASTTLREALRLAARERQLGELERAATGLAFVVGHKLQRFDEGLRYIDLARALAEGDDERESQVSAVLAMIWLSQGEYRDAEAETRRALALRERSMGADHPAVAQLRHNLALVLHAEGKLEEAEAEHRRALATVELELGAEHPDAASTRRDLAAVLESLGRFDEAEAELRRALAIAGRALGPTHPDLATIHAELAIALVGQGELADGEAELRRALAIEQASLGDAHPHVAEQRHNLANLLEERGRLDDAEAEHRAALAALETALGPDHPSLARSRTSLARLLLERGANAEAHALAEAAWQRRQGDDTPAYERAHTAFVLAQAVWADDVDDRPRARTLAERALVDYGNPEDAAIVRMWLDER